VESNERQWRQREQWQRVQGQHPRFGPELEQSGQGCDPGQRDRRPTGIFVCRPDQRVGLVNAKVGMEKDTTRQTQRYNGNKHTDAAPGVGGFEMVKPIDFLVAVDAVNATGRGKDGQPANDRVQLEYNKAER
jgi:hypothetical protein